VLLLLLRNGQECGGTWLFTSPRTGASRGHRRPCSAPGPLLLLLLLGSPAHKKGTLLLKHINLVLLQKGQHVSQQVALIPASHAPVVAAAPAAAVTAAAVTAAATAAAFRVTHIAADVALLPQPQPPLPPPLRHAAAP
jgi:hypothetical protein